MDKMMERSPPNSKKLFRTGTEKPKSTTEQSLPYITEKKIRASVNFDNEERKPRCTLETFYTLLHLLGQGVSSQVYLAQSKKKPYEYVAVKIIPKKILINNKDLAREIRILKLISHRYIVQLKDVFITSEHLQIIMEAIQGQELFDEICQRRSFTEDDAKDIVMKVLDAMGYLHSKQIVHRDLKPENIMFIKGEDGNQNLKIIDFGFAGTCDECTTAGTLGYKAPEILKGAPSTTKSDMWSIGVIAYILLVGFPPFFSHEEDKDMLQCVPFWSLFNDETEVLITSIKEGRIEYPDQFWSQISSEAKDFVQSLLKVDPEQRSSALEALRHPWIHTTEILVDNAIKEEPEPDILVPSPVSPPMMVDLDPQQEIIPTKNPETPPDPKLSITPLPLSQVTHHQPEDRSSRRLPSVNILLQAQPTQRNKKLREELKTKPLDDMSRSQFFEEISWVEEGVENLSLRELGEDVKGDVVEIEVVEEKTKKNGDGSKGTLKTKPTKAADTHSWKAMTTTTRWCGYCDDFIWGLTKESSLKCLKCKMVIHPDCLSKITKICPTQITTVKNSQGSSGPRSISYGPDMIQSNSNSSLNSNSSNSLGSPREKKEKRKSKKSKSKEKPKNERRRSSTGQKKSSLKSTDKGLIKSPSKKNVKDDVID